MLRMKIFLAVSLAMICLFLSGNASFGSLFLLAGGIDNNLTFRSSAFGRTTVNFGPTSPLPLTGTLTNGTASATYDYEDAGANAGIKITSFNYSLTQGQFAEMLTTFRIAPTVDLTYLISGSMHWSGIFGSPTLYTTIQDITVSEFSPTILSQFTLSGRGTNNFNKSISGGPSSTTGTLLAGHLYKLVLDIAVDAAPPCNPGTGIATGNASILLFGKEAGANVPEPASLAIWSLLGCLGLTVLWRKRTD